MGRSRRWSATLGWLLPLLAAAQVVLADATPQKTSTQAHQLTFSEIPRALSTTHGIQKRSVSILARNGDLPYFRKEWNKKLHPGFRGMNVEDKDEEDAPSKRYVGSLARGGGYPNVQGKRTIGNFYDTLEGYNPEEDPLDTYIPDEWDREDDPEYPLGKRGGISSLARAKGFGSYHGSGKRSVAALARSGELLSIGRGSNQDGSGSSASKRGLGSILRSGGISTIGKFPVHTLNSLANGKRGIESLARNYALPSMLNQEFEGKSELPEEFDESDNLPANEAIYDEGIPVDDSEEPKGIDIDGQMAKRHLGSFVRAYGFKPGMKRNLGSVLKNGGFGYTGKRNEEFFPYEYNSNDKRHFSSLLKNHGSYLTNKRDAYEDDEYEGPDKRHLSSILHDRNTVMYGKRYLGSIARQGMLGGRHEKRDDVDWGLNEGQWSRGDSSVGKRSITESDRLMKGETYFDRQDDTKTANETAEEELKNAAGSASGGLAGQRSTGQARDDTKRTNEDSSKHRQRRSLAVHYGSSDEYPMPVLQNTDFYDLGNPEEEEWEGTPGKRFMVSPRSDPGRWRRSGVEQQPRVAAGDAGRLAPAP